MSELESTVLGNYGFHEVEEGEVVVVMKWGDLYTRWDVCPVENSAV